MTPMPETPPNKAMKLTVLRCHGLCVRTSGATSASSVLPVHWAAEVAQRENDYE